MPNYIHKIDSHRAGMIVVRLLVLLMPIYGSVLPSLTEQALANAQKQNFRSTKDIDFIFSKLPTLEQVEQVILAADSFALTKLIQSITANSPAVPCDALTLYSDQIIGMVRVVIQKRTTLSQQLSLIIKVAEKQIERLTSDIAKINAQRNTLNITSKMGQLEDLLALLNQKYQTFNENQIKQNILKSQLQGFQATESNIKSNADTERQKLLQHKLDIVNYDTWIKKYEEEIASMKTKKKQSQNQIVKINANITKIQSVLTEVREQITQIQGQLSQVNSKADSLKKQYTKLEIQLQRLRSDISTNYMQDMNLAVKAKKLQDQADIQKSKLAYKDLQNLQYLNSVLQKILPKFVEQNNQIRFNCFGIWNSVTVLKTGSSIIYIVKGDKLPGYLEKAYLLQTVPQQSGRDMRLSVCDPYSQEWTQSFGPAFSQPSFNSSIVDSAFMEDSFNCLQPSQIYTDSGQILYIKNNSIRVRTDGNKLMYLKIGGCTRIESQYPLPRVGQKIYFKGVFAEAEGPVNLYEATCL